MHYEAVKSMRDALIAYGVPHAKAAEMAGVMADAMAHALPANPTQELLHNATRQLVEAYQPNAATAYPRVA